MDANFWDKRYSKPEYSYGIEPNPQLKLLLESLPKGRILFPAEGEGRNAVYAALQGWDVYAFDISTEGRTKAEKLAGKNNVNITYSIDSFESYNGASDSFDCIAMIFAHLPAETRRENFRKIFRLLKTGGVLIIIGFSREQSGKASGGPADISQLFTGEILSYIFPDLKNVSIKYLEYPLSEGEYHKGHASLIQFTGIK